MSSSSKHPAQLILIDDFEVWVTRKKVKRINVRIQPPDGRIEASMPMRAPMRELERFIYAQAEWIMRTQAKVATSTHSAAEFASDEDKQQWRAIVEAFTPPLIEKWERIIGVKSGKLAYRNMKSRWGSCQPSTGRICINTRLALYPPECLEYVVVHELCHLRERGHGAAFKALMDKYLPDWRERRAKLRS